METTKEKLAGWTKSGAIYTFLVKDHGKVTFDKSKASKELLDFFLDYGIGRIFPDRTSQLKGLAKLDAMRKLINLAESGSNTLSIRETAEERATRERGQRLEDLYECFKRFDGRDAVKVNAAIDKVAAANKWSEKDNAVMALLGTPQIKPIHTIVLQERASQRAKPGVVAGMDDVFAELGA
jgi:hypothetical protein